MTEPHSLKVAVIGGGSIGVSFAVAFSWGGWAVSVYDPDGDRRSSVPAEIQSKLCELGNAGLLREPILQITQRVEIAETLAKAVCDAELVLECAPEILELKRSLFAELDTSAPPNAVLVSAFSALPASSFCTGLAGRTRCLVAHPGNPPHLIAVIELAPAPFTDTSALSRASEIFQSIGMRPVIVRKEIEGFIFNRLQGAVLRDAYCLVRDGIASVEDIDIIVRDGLALRWSVIGPFETADLNTRGGIESHAEKMGPSYARMGCERGQNDPWTAELVSEVSLQRRRALPIEEWGERVRWRDRELTALIKFRKEKAALDAAQGDAPSASTDKAGIRPKLLS